MTSCWTRGSRTIWWRDLVTSKAHVWASCRSWRCQVSLNNQQDQNINVWDMQQNHNTRGDNQIRTRTWKYEHRCRLHDAFVRPRVRRCSWFNIGAQWCICATTCEAVFMIQHWCTMMYLCDHVWGGVHDSTLVHNDAFVRPRVRRCSWFNIGAQWCICATTCEVVFVIQHWYTMMHLCDHVWGGVRDSTLVHNDAFVRPRVRRCAWFNIGTQWCICATTCEAVCVIQHWYTMMHLCDHLWRERETKRCNNEVHKSIETIQQGSSILWRLTWGSNNMATVKNIWRRLTLGSTG